MKNLLTIKELAEAAGYSVPQIHNQIKRGNIKTAFNSSALILISRNEFNKVVNLSIASGKYKTFKRVSKKLLAE